MKKSILTIALFLVTCITIQAQREITTLKKVVLSTNKTIIYDGKKIEAFRFDSCIHTIDFVNNTYKFTVVDDTDMLYSDYEPRKVTNLTQYKEKGVYNIRFEHQNGIYHFFAYDDTEGGTIAVKQILVEVNYHSTEITEFLKEQNLLSEIYKLKFKYLNAQLK